MSKKVSLHPMHLALRCHAISKRSGCRCQAPAVRGFKVCRMHGARGGGLKGAANGNFRHGLRTKEAMRERRKLAALLTEARASLAAFNEEGRLHVPR